MKIEISAEARKVIGRLTAAGFEAYVVGGALRDALRGEKPNDFDVTTSATPDEMRAIFADFPLVLDGVKHGTVTVIVNRVPVETTTFRTDGSYTDSRHPDSVTFTRTLEEDLARRDFTVNAMAYGEKVGVVDLFGGKKDLENRLLRAVGEPNRRFHEDALRILRGFRIISKLGFSLDGATYRAMTEWQAGLDNVSAERITAELFGILVGDFADSALSLMKKSGILGRILPGALPGKIERLPKDAVCRLAFLYRASSPVLSHLRLSNAQKDDLFAYLALMEYDFTDFSEPAVRHFLARSSARAGNAIALAEASGGVLFREFRAVAEKVTACGDCISMKNLALSGTDLVALGYKGKSVGEALSYLFGRVLEDPALNEKEDLLALLENLPKDENHAF